MILRLQKKTVADNIRRESLLTAPAPVMQSTMPFTCAMFFVSSGRPGFEQYHLNSSSNTNWPLPPDRAYSGTFHALSLKWK